MLKEVVKHILIGIATAVTVIVLSVSLIMLAFTYQNTQRHEKFQATYVETQNDH